MDERMHLRVVLRESHAGKIYEAAEAVADPKSRRYGAYEERPTILGWGSPAPDERKRVLDVFSGLEIHAVGASPLLIVSGTLSELSAHFQPGTLERLDRENSRGLQVPPWEWAGPLTDCEKLIRTVHVVHCSEAPDSNARAVRGSDAPAPTRGWMFSHLPGKHGRRAIHHKHRARSLEGPHPPRLEEGATPELIRAIYGFPNDLDGDGQTIAIMSIGASDRQTREQLDRDLRTFWTEFGIARTDGLAYREVGPRAAVAPPNALYRLEATMGPAWIGALAPKAKIVVYEMASDFPDPWLGAVEMAVADEEHRPTVLCITWTVPEEFYYRQFNRSSISLALAKAAALGITVVVGAGDWGVYDGRPGAVLRSDPGAGKVARAAWPHATFPSTEERVLSVGGTLVSTLNPLTEIGWSGPLPPDPDLARELPFVSLATSGGFSQRVPVPEWQREAVLGGGEQRIYARANNVPAVLPYGRGYPDVALMAAGPSLARGNPPGLSATGYQLVVDNEWIDYAGGTSMAAPVWASAIAVLNQKRERSGLPRLGFFNPVLYYLGRTRPISGPNAVLRQISAGSSDIEFRVVTGERQTHHHVLAGYRAGPQWDPVTGLGVPSVEHLGAAVLEYPRVASPA